MAFLHHPQSGTSCKTVKIWKLNLLVGSLIVALVVTLEEFSQLFIQYRSFDLTDLLFDYAGIFLFGQLAYYLTKRWLRKPGKEL